MHQDPRFPNLFILDHPLILHKLSYMRDKKTSTRTFRDLLREITLLMGYEITRNLPLTTRAIETPLVPMQAPVIAGKKLAVVPVLRAGIGMADGLLELIPSARVGHVGVYRGDDLQPVEYLVRLPEVEGRTFILCDPMLATGNSAIHATRVLRDRGVPAEDILYLALVAAPEGAAAWHKAHPDVPCYVAALDSHLDENAYIIPGLGDAGDRLFGTKN
jgi:uracil phosphoribosyltransferase